MNDIDPDGSAAAAANRVRDVLHGFGRADLAALRGLRDVAGWAQAAEAELRLRSTRILEAIDDDALQLIANGQLNFNALCVEVIAKLDKPG